jgi:membrane associated rhomboid family serine protease
MLSDRSYMQEPPGRYRSAAMTLFWVIIGVFLLQQIDLFYNGGTLHRFLALSTGGIAKGYLWQLLTFQFLHSGPWHLLFNLLGLYSFGRGLEQVIGTRHFLQGYFAAGVVGGIFQLILAWINPNLWGFVILGASAGICGIIAIYAMIEPHSDAGQAVRNWPRFTLHLFYRRANWRDRPRRALRGIACWRWVCALVYEQRLAFS